MNKENHKKLEEALSLIIFLSMILYVIAMLSISIFKPTVLFTILGFSSMVIILSSLAFLSYINYIRMQNQTKNLIKLLAYKFG